jgi:hypothetical protein
LWSRPAGPSPNGFPGSFGDRLREPALLLGGRQLGNEVDPVVNQLVVPRARVEAWHDHGNRRELIPMNDDSLLETVYRAWVATEPDDKRSARSWASI